jgi:hypothetical protein
MPRTGRRRSLSIAAAVVAVLCAPAAAQAATYTVTGVPADGACMAPADLTCGDLSNAATAAATGDVFNVASATYGSATFDVSVTLAGNPTFGVNGSLAFTGSGGAPSKIQHLVLAQVNGSAAGIISQSPAGLIIEDTVVASPNGDGVTFSAGTTNKIVRSAIATGGLATAAVRVTSADDSSDDKKLTMESVLASGGVAGLSVNTGNGNGLSSHPGDVDLVLHHVTLAGATNGLVLNASQANPLVGGPFGSIDAVVTDSIIQNGTAKSNYAGILLGIPITAPPNTVTDSYTRTLQVPLDASAGDVFVGPTTGNFRLKAGSPAIDKGAISPGESGTDIDGDPRPGPVTDLGADEYVAPVIPPPPPPPGATNDGTPPVVKITKPTANQRIALTKKTTKTTTKTVTRKGKKVKVKVKKTTSKPVKIGFAGTAADASGIKGVLLAVQKISTTVSKPKTAAKSSQTTTPAPVTKCKWLNGTKGIVLKSCTAPPLLLAKLGKDGSWTYNVKSTIKLGAGKYRIIVIGVDNSGAAGNTATPADAVRTFTLTK